jgi:hypothetical protein
MPAMHILFRQWIRLGNRHPWIVGGLVALVAALASAIPAIVRWPQPLAHDEFSYLLQADTFVHGRLTNPPHPLAEHFETFQVIQHPTYQSKYPIGQGLALAAGTLLTGQPLAGVWLSTALACAAVYYMLRAWLPPAWALVGTAVGILRIVFGSAANVSPGYWSQSYWGGSMAVLGGALFLGAVRRWYRKASARDAIVGSLGAAILANTRPYEGLCCRPLPRTSVRTVVLKLLLPATAILAPVFWGMTEYNLRVTGDRFTMPYFVYERQYNATPQFAVWQQAPENLRWGNEVMARFYTEVEPVTARDSIPTRFVKRLDPTARFFFGYVLLMLLIPLPWLWSWCWLRVAVFTCLAVMGGGLLAHAFFPHYLGPIAPLFFLMIAAGWRYCYVGLRHNSQARAGMTFIFSLAAVVVSVSPLITYRIERRSANWSEVRAEIDAQLSRSGEQHVILVRYDEDHHGGMEWVYNRADIDGSPVVWARDLGPERNRKLIAYYHPRRTMWLLLADEKPPALIPFQVERP